MKTHTKKKLYRAMMRKLAKDGMVNDASGRMVNRSQLSDNSMKRDYYPQK